jgi:hypothetical protein
MVPCILGGIVLGGSLAPRTAVAGDVPPIRLSAERLSLGNSTVKPDGNGLKVAFAKADWPSVWFGAGKAYESPDMSAMGGIAFEVHNPNDAPLTVFIRVDDSPEADGQKHCRTGNATLAPDETATLIFPFSGEVKGMRAGPPLVSRADKPKQLSVYGDPLNEKNIVAFQVFLAQPGRAYDLNLRGVRFLPKPDLVGIVDRWGQYAKADWPGKVTNDADLTRHATEERAWLKANPPLTDRDEYGGWKNGPALKASGFFRTALVSNGKEITAPKPGEPLPAGARWWLVTPGGHLFWSAGVDCVRPYAEGPIAGRESMFTELTAEEKQRGQTDFYHRNLGRKYGGDWQKGWIESDVARLRSWGFNTIGNWSEPAIFRARQVPYTVPLYVNGLPKIGANPLSDYFDEKFPELARGSFLDQTKEWKNDPWCLGYFVDNELAWDTWAQMGTGGEYVVARDTLAAPATQPARRAFVKLLQARYATPADWGKAWGISRTDWDAPVTIKASELNATAKADCAAFSTALAERYFSVMREMLKAAAPNQLYLGCRFAIRPPEMVNVAARYCDVVSFNIYEDAVEPKTWGFTERLGKPVIIGEFHFGATDRGMFHPGLRERPNQAERAKAYETYVKSVRAQPAFVGCHWFQWIDEPLTGRFDGENYNIGLLTITDTPYPEMRDAARRVHSGLYGP